MIREITSRENEKLKFARSLLKSKTRAKESKFIAEGYRILTLALDSNSKIDYIIINEDFEKKMLEGKEEYKNLLSDFASENIQIFKTSDKNFAEISDTENTQGILGICSFKKEKFSNINREVSKAKEKFLNINREVSKAKEKFSNINKEVSKIKENNFLIVLDRVQDPGNMGTIIRTADAAGADGIVVLKGSVDVYNPKTIRSTMGSIFSIDIFYEDEESAIEKLQSNGFKIVSSYLDTDNFYDKVDYGEKVALVIGNEANGISENIISKSDLLVKIPMYGKAESLNAAISSAILMYEIKKSII
ncbi:MAG: RNA methyltransferase [Clostridioides sp.]|jgi:TrmH family RNA methyltransferase|nr:RNA methyltransferase [Clostridioides sp.]